MLYFENIFNHKKEYAVFIHGFGGSTKTWKRQIDRFSEQYNLLLIDLEGHGNSQEERCTRKTLDKSSRQIREVLDANGIAKAVFVGLSLGTLILLNFASSYPEYVDSLVLGGGILKLDFKRRLLVNFANVVKRILPKDLLYNFLAYILLPRKNHEKSRQVFVREGQKMNRYEFMAWLGVLRESVNVRGWIDHINGAKIKVLYIMGNEDYMFLKSVENMIHCFKNARLSIIEKCGHVCSIEKAAEFNELALNYLSKAIRKPRKLFA